MRGLTQKEREEYAHMTRNAEQLTFDLAGSESVPKGIIYGYCRVSTPKQSMDRQIRNVRKAYPEAVIVRDEYSGTTMQRPNWQRLYNKVKTGDTIVFDSVSRMSRDADEGFDVYSKLFEKKVNLVFLKEPHVNTETFRRALQNAVPMTGTTVDLILQGVNAYLLELAKEQIRIAFDQSEKEVQDLHQRTKEGIETARLNGKQIGQRKGNKLHVKKKDPAKDKIRQLSRSFGGSLDDKDCMKLVGVSRATFYKYKKEIKNE